MLARRPNVKPADRLRHGTNFILGRGDERREQRLEKTMRSALGLTASLRDHLASLLCAALFTGIVTLLSAMLGLPQAIAAMTAAAAIFFWLCPPRLLAL